MWYRTLSVAVVCTLLAVQTAWSQPPGRGGRNTDDALRKLEQEVAQIKAEIQKLQTAQNQTRPNRGAPPALADRRGPNGPGRPGGPGTFGGPMGFRGQQFGAQRWNQPGGPGAFWGQAAFRGQPFGAQRWNQPVSRQGGRAAQFQGRGHKHRHHGHHKHHGKKGAGKHPGKQQKAKPSKRN